MEVWQQLKWTLERQKVRHSYATGDNHLGASSDLDARLDSWQDELELHHEREGRAENALLDEEGE
jgi:hypothetical protein